MDDISGSIKYNHGKKSRSDRLQFLKIYYDKQIGEKIIKKMWLQIQSPGINEKNIFFILEEF